MKQNVKPLDRFIRLFLGIAVLSLVFLGPQTAWGYLGLIALVSALSGFCPLYRLFGVETSCCEQKRDKSQLHKV